MRKVRPIRIEEDIAYVPLTQGYEAVIDAADAHLVAGHNWVAHVVRRRDRSIINVYAERTQRLDGRKRRFAMHRVICGVPDDLLVDHENCDGLNNRRSNLRPATRSENSKNSRISIANKTGHKGVRLHPSGAWVARIRVNGSLIHIGSFASKDDAAAAYASASKLYHGEFGRVA